MKQLSVLSLRVITAVCLLSSLGLILAYGDQRIIVGTLMLIWLLAALEWANLFRLEKFWLIVFIGLGPLLAYGLFKISLLFLGLGALFTWLGLGGWIYAYERNAKVWVLNPVFSISLGYLVLLPMLLALFQLYISPHGLLLIVALIALVSGGDIIAFFVGRSFGNKRLAPRTSPGKSIEGSLGALILIAVISYLITVSWALVFLAMITVVASVIGDLAESMFKRWRGVKDSGRCLPGHGGILDRLDSLSAAAPIYVLMLHYLGQI